MAKYTRINTGVASPVAGDPFAHLQESGYTEDMIPDPRKAIQESVGKVPAAAPEGPTGRDLLAGHAQVGSIEDVQRFTGSRLAPAAEEEVILDDEGQPILDAEGQKQFRQIDPVDYNDQLAVARAGYQDLSEQIREISANPTRSQDTVRSIMQGRYDTSFNEPAGRRASLEKDSESLEHFVNKVASPLALASNNAYKALIQRSTTKAAAGIREDGQVITAGEFLLTKMGDTSKEAAQMLATLAGLALTKAVSQMGQRSEKKKWQEANKENPAPEGTEYLSEVINAGTAFLSAAFQNANINLDRADAEFAMKHLVMHQVANGDFEVATVDKNGKPIDRPALVAKRDVKNHSRELERLADVVTRSWSRPASSNTPNATGAGFGSVPRITSKSSLRDPMIDKVLGEDGSLNVTAAEFTKNILGSVAYVFRKQDLDRKVKEIELVMQGAQYNSKNQFIYSTHPLAKRNGLDQGSYESAMANVDKPEGFDITSEESKARFRVIQMEDAATVMGQKLQDIQFTLESIASKTGLRYAEWMHSPSNQRFYVNSYDLDYMGSKVVIRDIMAMANQDTTHVNSLFDPREIGNLKNVAKSIFYRDGAEAVEMLKNLNPSTLGALGAMHAAVMYHYTALPSPDHREMKRPTQMHTAEAIALYTPAMGAKLADLGRKYQAFLNDPSIEADPEMMGLWVATPKGEALGTLNLWKDFARAEAAFKDPNPQNKVIPFTFHTFEDGNQNGIFLQALFFGAGSTLTGNDAVVSLGTANPNIQDLRQDTLDIMVHKLDDYLEDRSDARIAWKNFWRTATEGGKNSSDVARDFLKAPLMQAAYGKDAAMFRDVLLETLESGGYNRLVKSTFIDTKIYESIDDLSVDLARGVELALHQVIDTASMHVMKKFGRNFAFLNSPAIFRGITGDHIAIAGHAVTPVNKRVSKNYVRTKLSDGTEALTKEFKYEGNEIVNPETGETVELPDFEMRMVPDSTKGVMKFFNFKTRKYDYFHNPKGSTLANSLGVLMIQALDGDLVKWTTIKANEGLKVPRPVTWVHDSIISTPGQGLIYNTIYNNVAIPGAIHEIKKMGQRIQNALDDARFREIKAVMQKGEPVGIGDEGEYAAIGAYLDQQVDKIDPELNEREIVDADGKVRKVPTNYKLHFLQRYIAKQKSKGQPRMGLKSTQERWDDMVLQDELFGANRTEMSMAERAWNEYVSKTQKFLDEARALGWVPKGLMPERQRRYNAIEAKNFKPLLELVETHLGTRGGETDAWVKAFPKRVENAAENLFVTAGPGGIKQMGASGGEPAAKLAGPIKLEPKFKQKTRLDEIEERLGDEFDNRYKRAVSEYNREGGIDPFTGEPLPNPNMSEADLKAAREEYINNKMAQLGHLVPPPLTKGMGLGEKDPDSPFGPPLIPKITARKHKGWTEEDRILRGDRDNDPF